MAKLKAAGVSKRRMLQFLLHDPETLLHGNETISLDGVDVGHIQVGAYGHSLGGAVGIGFVERDAPLGQPKPLTQAGGKSTSPEAESL